MASSQASTLTIASRERRTSTHIVQTTVVRKPLLSRRLMDVAEGVHRDLTNKEIAKELHIDETTVKTHIHRAMEILDVRSRVGIALWYERNVYNKQ
jgi:DNA-binding NarL/FixJ family response regulator